MGYPAELPGLGLGQDYVCLLLPPCKELGHVFVMVRDDRACKDSGVDPEEVQKDPVSHEKLDKFKQSNPPVHQHPLCCLFPRDQPGPRG